VIETIYGNIGMDPGIEEIVATEKGRDVTAMTATDQLEAQQRYLAVALVLGSDCARYGKLIENLENDYLQGCNNYPLTVTGVYNLLSNWKQDPRNLTWSVGVTNDGVSFTNLDGSKDDEAGDVAMATTASGGSGSGKSCTRDKSKVICCQCGKKGHYPSECDNECLIHTNAADRTNASTTSSLTTTGSSTAASTTA
jgi:hypothetical protein